jgi:hypothetical protein
VQAIGRATSRHILETHEAVFMTEVETRARRRWESMTRQMAGL